MDLLKNIFDSFIICESVKCNSVELYFNEQSCKVGPEIIDVNSDEPVFYPFSIKISKCSGSCNNISDPCAKMCVPDVVKNLNVKVFNLMSRTNETKYIKWHETCKCKCRLDASVCNNKLRWNDDKCRCECKELTDKGVCDRGYISDPSNCECKWNKSCDVGEYLDYKNCKCRKKLVDKLVEEYNENINKTSLVEIKSTKCNHNSVVLHIVLLSIIFIINIGIAAYFFYYKYMNHIKRMFLNMIMSIKVKFININGRNHANRNQK